MNDKYTATLLSYWLLRLLLVGSLDCSIEAASAVEPLERDSPIVRVDIAKPVGVSARFDSIMHQLPDGSLFVQGNRSTDGGRTWVSSPEAVRATFHDQWRHSAGCVLREGAYIGLGSRCEFPGLRRRILKVYRSGDQLATIEGPQDATLEIAEGGGGFSETGEYHGGVAVDHSLIELDDGTLLATCYGYWRGDREFSMLEKYPPEMGIYKTRAWVIASTDKGDTWTVRGTPGYWSELGEEGMGEPGLIELANGDLLMLMRNGEAGAPIFQCRSADKGVTWTKPVARGVRGVWPNLCLMDSGWLVAAAGRPDYRLWISYNGTGKHWDKEVLVAKGGKGYASIIEAEPNVLVYCGWNKAKRHLDVRRIRLLLD